MKDKYARHQINYTLKYFSHLLSGSEMVALSALIFIVKDVRNGEDYEEVVISIAGIDEPSEEIKVLLSDGMFELRNKLAVKLLNTYKNEIYANCCPICEKLPMTPLAKQCLWCGYSWRDKKI
jgi:hypothetical protein